MVRVCLAGWAVFLIVAALAVANAQTAHASPAPSPTGSDCSWQENGTEIVIGKIPYRCHCARLRGPNGPEVMCRWFRKDRLPKAPLPKKKPAARYAIRTGVIA